MNRRKFFSSSFAGAAWLSGSGDGESQTADSLAPGDMPGFSGPAGRELAIVNADIITLDPRRPAASAVLVRGGRIVLVGDNREVRSQAGKAPEYDAGGRVVIPGFVDNHCHVEDSCVVGDEQPTLHGLKSISEMVAKVRSVAGRTPKGDWVLKDESEHPQIVAFAQKRHAYVICGRIPVVKGKIETDGMEIMVRGDPEMRRPFVVLIANAKRFPNANVTGAQKLADYLTSAKGQQFLNEFAAKQPDGVPLFYPVSQ